MTLNEHRKVLKNLMLEILILSIIQGVTEFIPVSSSSHLIIISSLLNFENQSLSIDVSLHIGSFLAVILFFKKEIFNFIQNKLLLIKIILGSMPVMVSGYILVKFNLIEYLRNIELIGWTTIVFGFLLYFSDKFQMKNNIKDNLNFKSIFFIGFLQVLSLIPGVSRSGITITGARFLKFNRVESAKISFLLSIPTLAAVSLFGVKNLIESGDIYFSVASLASIILSFVFSYITIKYFLIFLKKFSLNLFVAYRILLGLILLIFAYL